MNSIDFCYWLQGYFEIRESDKRLTVRQIQIIKNHLELSFLHDDIKTVQSYPEQISPKDFCIWMKGYLSLPELNISIDNIQSKLHNVFFHTIDVIRKTETTATENELNSAHSGLEFGMAGSRNSEGVVIKC